MNQELYEERYRIFKEKVIEKNHNLVAAFEAFDKSDCKSLLFIVVSIDDKKVYFFTKQNSTVKPNWKEITYNIIEEISAKWDGLSEHLINQKEEDIKCTGMNFYDWLVKDVLPTGCDRTSEVWIYCEDADIDPIWEWLYIKSSNGECFFWGDKFHIIRIPENGEFGISNNPCQINKVAFISDVECSCKCGDEECFVGLPEENKIDLRYLKGDTNLDAFDCVHLVARSSIVTTDLLNSCESALSKAKFKFLFLHIRTEEHDRTLDDLQKLKKIFIRPADIWIDTSLNLPNDSEAPYFTKYFYEELWSKKGIAESATKARKKIEEEKKDLGCKNFWRLVYVVKGNP